MVVSVALMIAPGSFGMPVIAILKSGGLHPYEVFSNKSATTLSMQAWVPMVWVRHSFTEITIWVKLISPQLSSFTIIVSSPVTGLPSIVAMV
jgi:predicted ATP-grasp superfamily ATP-dependent carboligase